MQSTPIMNDTYNTKNKCTRMLKYGGHAPVVVKPPLDFRLMSSDVWPLDLNILYLKSPGRFA